MQLLFNHGIEFEGLEANLLQSAPINFVHVNWRSKRIVMYISASPYPHPEIVLNAANAGDPLPRPTHPKPAPDSSPRCKENNGMHCAIHPFPTGDRDAIDAWGKLHGFSSKAIEIGSGWIDDIKSGTSTAIHKLDNLYSEAAPHIEETFQNPAVKTSLEVAAAALVFLGASRFVRI